MSTQTFSKVFLFPNNKRKTENNFSYYYWAGPWERLAHGRFRPAQTERREGRWPGSGLRPKAVLAQLGRGETPRHAGVPDATAVRPLPAGRRPLPTTIGQTGVSAGSARRWRTRAGYPRGWRRDGGSPSTARPSTAAP